MAKDKPVRTELAPHIHRALKLLAEKKGRTMTLYLADLVEHTVYEEGKTDELIAAALNEGPKPLSVEVNE